MPKPKACAESALDSEPVYTIGVVARLLKVCPATLRIWERKGLVKPARLGKNRFYSACDLERLRMAKDLIQKQRLNIEGAKSVLKLTNCWDIRRCAPKVRSACSVYRSHTGKA